MNGYQILADSYKKLLEKDTEDTVSMERRIRILEFLGTCSEEDIAELYDSGAFNDITKGYCRKAMQTVGFTSEQIGAVLEEVKWLHDTLGAGDVVK